MVSEDMKDKNLKELELLRESLKDAKTLEEQLAIAKQILTLTEKLEIELKS